MWIASEIRKFVPLIYIKLTKLWKIKICCLIVEINYDIYLGNASTSGNRSIKWKTSTAKCRTKTKDRRRSQSSRRSISTTTGRTNSNFRSSAYWTGNWTSEWTGKSANSIYSATPSQLRGFVVSNSSFYPTRGTGKNIVRIISTFGRKQ